MFDESFTFGGRPSPAVDMSHDSLDSQQDCFFTGITNDTALKSNALPRSCPRARYQQPSSMSQALNERRRRRISVGSLTTSFQSATVADAASEDREMDAYQLPAWPSPGGSDFDQGPGLDLLSSSPASSVAGISGPPTPTSLVSPFTYMHSHEQGFFPPTLEPFESMEPTTSSSSTGTNGPTSEPAPAKSTTTSTTLSRSARPQLYTSHSTSSYFSLPSPSYASNSSTSRSRYKRRRALTPLDLPASHLSLLDLIAREERHPSELNDMADAPSRSPTPEDWARNAAALEKLGVNVVGPFWGYKPTSESAEGGMDVVDEEPITATVSVTEAGRMGRIGKRSSSGTGYSDVACANARTRSVSRESGKKKIGKSGRGL